MSTAHFEATLTRIVPTPGAYDSLALEIRMTLGLSDGARVGSASVLSRSDGTPTPEVLGGMAAVLRSEAARMGWTGPEVESLATRMTLSVLGEMPSMRRVPVGGVHSIRRAVPVVDSDASVPDVEAARAPVPPTTPAPPTRTHSVLFGMR